MPNPAATLSNLLRNSIISHSYSYFWFYLYAEGWAVYKSKEFQTAWCMLYSIGCKLSDHQPKDYRIRDAIDKQKAEILNYFKHLVKSVIVSFFDLPLTNTKIINQ